MNAHFIVDLQRVPCSPGAKVPCYSVHGEVDLLVETLDLDRVPVLIIQETPQGHGDLSATGVGLSIVYKEEKE